MPIYAYKCKNCEHTFEARQRFSDSPLTECPVCHGKIRRVISPVGVVFKGSGFYVTDNRNGKSNSAITGNNKKLDGDPTPSAGDSDDNTKAKNETSPVVSEKQKRSASDSAQTSSSV